MTRRDTGWRRRHRDRCLPIQHFHYRLSAWRRNVLSDWASCSRRHWFGHGAGHFRGSKTQGKQSFSELKSGLLSRAFLLPFIWRSETSHITLFALKEKYGRRGIFFASRLRHALSIFVCSLELPQSRYFTPNTIPISCHILTLPLLRPNFSAGISHSSVGKTVMALIGTSYHANFCGEAELFVLCIFPKLLPSYPHRSPGECFDKLLRMWL